MVMPFDFLAVVKLQFEIFYLMVSFSVADFPVPYGTWTYMLKTIKLLYEVYIHIYSGVSFKTSG